MVVEGDGAGWVGVTDEQGWGCGVVAFFSPSILLMFIRPTNDTIPW